MPTKPPAKRMDNDLGSGSSSTNRIATTQYCSARHKLDAMAIIVASTPSRKGFGLYGLLTPKHPSGS